MILLPGQHVGRELAIRDPHPLSRRHGVLGGEIVVGRSIVRDRPAEFRATGRVAELTDETERARRQLRADVAALDPFGPPRGEPHAKDATLPLARTQGGALLHIYEELAQHRGQMEITRDLLRTPWAQFG